MQTAGQWVELSDDKLASSDAITARHDAYIGDTKPAEPAHEQLQELQNTDECYTTYWNDDANARCWCKHRSSYPWTRAAADVVSSLQVMLALRLQLLTLVLMVLLS